MRRFLKTQLTNGQPFLLNLDHVEGIVEEPAMVGKEAFTVVYLEGDRTYHLDEDFRELVVTLAIEGGVIRTPKEVAGHKARLDA